MLPPDVRMAAQKASSAVSSSFKPDSILQSPLAAQQAMASRVQQMANKLATQQFEHEQAQANTQQVFDFLLDTLQELPAYFYDALIRQSNQPITHTQSQIASEPTGFPFSHGIPGDIRTEVDGDRSVGIMHLLWHTVSFTTRGNLQPLALPRKNREPVLTGRIMALHGNFRQWANDPFTQSPASLLRYEVASLFIPADPLSPAIMKTAFSNDNEVFLMQREAPRAFVLKVLEWVCGGGFFHEGTE